MVITTWYYLVGDDGAVQFMLMRSNLPKMEFTYPVDLGVHARQPCYPDQEAMENCEVLGGTCHYSGSSYLAQDLYNRFLRYQDPEYLWAQLEDYYGRVFGSF